MSGKNKDFIFLIFDTKSNLWKDLLLLIHVELWPWKLLFLATYIFNTSWNHAMWEKKPQSSNKENILKWVPQILADQWTLHPDFHTLQRPYAYNVFYECSLSKTISSSCDAQRFLWELMILRRWMNECLRTIHKRRLPKF